MEPYLCLFSDSRFLQDPANKNKQATPTPNMKCHQTERSTCGRSVGGIVISQRAFTAFLLWASEILQDSESPKQALINAFYNMSAKPIARLCDCKGTEKNVYVQEKFTFFCHRLHFFSVASRIKVPSKVLYFFHSCKYIHKKIAIHVRKHKWQS